jgi:hypothetical protein
MMLMNATAVSTASSRRVIVEKVTADIAEKYSVQIVSQRSDSIKLSKNCPSYWL